MDNTREKLIELLTDRIPGCDNELRYVDDERVERLADHLIAHGVTLQEHDHYWATERAYKNGYEQGKKDALKWIPVSERLPELWQDCFVLVKMKYDWEKDYEYNVDAGCYVGEYGYIDCFNTINDWNEGQEYIHITHWMPLPEPPKGE
jgi:hypothetical protein